MWTGRSGSHVHAIGVCIPVRLVPYVTAQSHDAAHHSGVSVTHG
jgi:hypothetical protein